VRYTSLKVCSYVMICYVTYTHTRTMSVNGGT